MAASARKISRINERERVKADSITVTLKELVASQIALGNLSLQPLRAKAAFRVSRMLKAVQSELELCEKQRIALLEKHGTLDEATNQYKFDPLEKRKEFESEYEEMLTAEVNLAVASLKIEEIADVTLASADFLTLDWLFLES